MASHSSSPMASHSSSPMTFFDSTSEINQQDIELAEIIPLIPKSVPGQGQSAKVQWLFPKSEDCCIYRVPHAISKSNPEAYTPQLLIIGPLHHSLRMLALQRNNEHNDAKFVGYASMEQHKKVYLSQFESRIGGSVDEFRIIIQNNEERIRGSYCESTLWINSTDFVNMILHDAVFILEFSLRVNTCQSGEVLNFSDDVLMSQPSLANSAKYDLMLIENQIPYFIIKELFASIVSRLGPDQRSLHQLVMRLFGLGAKIKYCTFLNFRSSIVPS